MGFPLGWADAINANDSMTAAPAHRVKMEAFMDAENCRRP
jgi:hypothetical protein